MPVHGVLMGYSYAQDGPSQRKTQHFLKFLATEQSIAMMTALFSCIVLGYGCRATNSDGPQEQWELYDIENDFSQATDLSD